MRKLFALAAVILLATSAPTLTPRQKALHALNRLGFGPRPGDADRVLAIGVDKWIDEQLHPERIADRAVEARLAQLPTMSMSNADILKKYFVPVQMARKEAKATGDRAALMDIPYDERPQRVMDDLLTQRIVRAA